MLVSLGAFPSFLGAAASANVHALKALWPQQVTQIYSLNRDAWVLKQLQKIRGLENILSLKDLLHPSDELAAALERWQVVFRVNDVLAEALKEEDPARLLVAARRFLRDLRRGGEESFVTETLDPETQRRLEWCYRAGDLVFGRNPPLRSALTEMMDEPVGEFLNFRVIDSYARALAYHVRCLRKEALDVIAPSFSIPRGVDPNRPLPDRGLRHRGARFSAICWTTVGPNYLIRRRYPVGDANGLSRGDDWFSLNLVALDPGAPTHWRKAFTVSVREGQVTEGLSFTPAEETVNHDPAIANQVFAASFDVRGGRMIRRQGSASFSYHYDMRIHPVSDHLTWLRAAHLDLRDVPSGVHPYDADIFTDRRAGVMWQGEMLWGWNPPIHRDWVATTLRELGLRLG